MTHNKKPSNMVIFVETVIPSPPPVCPVVAEEEKCIEILDGRFIK